MSGSFLLVPAFLIVTLFTLGCTTAEQHSEPPGQWIQSGLLALKVPGQDGWFSGARRSAAIELHYRLSGEQRSSLLLYGARILDVRIVSELRKDWSKENASILVARLYDRAGMDLLILAQESESLSESDCFRFELRQLSRFDPDRYTPVTQLDLITYLCRKSHSDDIAQVYLARRQEDPVAVEADWPFETLPFSISDHFRWDSN